jgi:hypothetical protein
MRTVIALHSSAVLTILGAEQLVHGEQLPPSPKCRARFREVRFHRGVVCLLADANEYEQSH